MFEDDSDHVYDVVRNDQGQYSIWPITHPTPAGWSATGHRGDKEACLAHIATVWTDQRPVNTDAAR